MLDLTKVNQLGWLTMPMRVSPLQFDELGMEQIKDQEGSWMKMMLKEEWTSRMVLMRREFL